MSLAGQFKTIRLIDLRVWAFVSAVLVYAVFGSPTPDNPGLVEILIAFLLIVSAGVVGVFQAFKLDLNAPLWQGAGAIMLCFGVGVPTLKGIIDGNHIALIIRDLAPFLFLALPLFFILLMKAQAQFGKRALQGVLVLGLVFALRAVVEQASGVLTVLSRLQPSDELTYFANMPSVLFAALFFIYTGSKLWLGRLGVRTILKGIMCFILALIIIVPIMLSAQRASIGFIIIYGLGLLGYGLYKAPLRALGLLGIITIAAFPFYGVLFDVAETLAQKTALVGVNMRFAELEAVWSEVSGSPFDLMFGKGWGGSFESPAVGEVRVNFTHSLISSVLLKTGMAGLLVIGFYIFGFVRILWGKLMHSPALVCALAGPFIIDVFLYASFKSLDFGLILLLIGLIGFSDQNNERSYA